MKERQNQQHIRCLIVRRGNTWKINLFPQRFAIIEIYYMFVVKVQLALIADRLHQSADRYFDVVTPPSTTQT